MAPLVRHVGSRAALQAHEHIYPATGALHARGVPTADEVVALEVARRADEAKLRKRAPCAQHQA